MFDLLDGLNEEQKQAVTAGDGPLLIIAGAGSGKTKVLVTRCAYLLSERSIWPSSILAVTFTNKAAREMRERLELLTGIDVQRMWLGTFHSVCARILRIEAQYCSFDSNYVIWDDSDQQSILKSIIADLGLDDKKYSPRAMSSYISDCKNSMLLPADALADADGPYEQTAAKVYGVYERQRQNNNALDFDDLILQTVLLFRREPAVLSRYKEKFRYIFVDEYQDTNHSQYVLVKLLAGENGNLCVVGDPDQSIYSWRGADIRNILEFEKDYPDAKKIMLVQNYRSTQNILEAANAVISNNAGRFEKELWSDKGAGELVHHHIAPTDKDEALYCLETINKLLKHGYSYKSFAILYRTHSQSRSLEDACVKFGFPYRIYGGMKFYERKEVKDTIAYLKVLSNPFDSLSLTRIYNEPRRGIGKTTWDKLLAAAEERNIPAYSLLSCIEEVEWSNKSIPFKLSLFYKMLEDLRDFAEKNTLAALVQEIWRVTGYTDALENDPEGADRLENLQELLNVAVDFDQELTKGYILDEGETALGAFLTKISLATDMDNAEPNEEHITLMTLHAAKGLEYPVVFIVGMEEGIFPYSKAQFDETELEEERRLCYVGMTRAKERLFLINCGRRMQWGNIVNNKSSRFLDEIPDMLLEKSGAAMNSFYNDYGRANTTPKTSNNTGSFAAYKSTPVKKSTSVFAFGKPKQETKKSSSAESLVKIGDKVIHAKYGLGVVISTAGEGESFEVGVAFPDLGIKQLIWQYAPIKKAEV